ncbi:UPF0481 protein At3g47200-like [Primulina eburnea]|uniref:UPF0481 protein At3g47200-like n=1 Tax=Primulina eburnea TaxID=1245227 RepID=UPI003C6C2AE3
MGDDEPCVIKINSEDEPWVIKINSELNNMSNTSTQSAQWSKRSIYRVSACVTDLNKKAYQPQMVSIGPYHHGEENLRPMEEHKHRALLHFLKRSKKPLQSFIDELTPVVQDLKDAYDQLTDPKWHKDTEAFIKLMIMDGCFILEILRTTSQPQPQPQPQPQSQPQPTTTDGGDDKTTDHNYAANDPIFSSHGRLNIVPYLKRDMLMLENQIPILVLKKLVDVQNDEKQVSVQNVNPSKKGKDLTKAILSFFSQASVKNTGFDKCLHILDVYRKSLLQDDHHHGDKDQIHTDQPHHDSNQGGDEIIRSATELIEAGIQIKESKTRSLKDISFRKGVLKLPLIVVDDALESLYLNLIAFERFHVGAGNEITSYIFFMDNIIDNARDVSLLHSCGVIQNALGSDKAVANLFNSLSKDVTLDPKSSLDMVHKKVSRYCQRPWHKWRANLMHTYFTNPWAILSVVAAIFLFALTIIQTVYSTLSYVNPSD